MFVFGRNCVSKKYFDLSIWFDKSFCLDTSIWWISYIFRGDLSFVFCRMLFSVKMRFCLKWNIFMMWVPPPGKINQRITKKHYFDKPFDLTRENRLTLKLLTSRDSLSVVPQYSLSVAKGKLFILVFSYFKQLNIV